ncbi:MAG: type II secretion system GspH family protein [Dechloromonas sp.]|nr:type II secretion system GspH family protein [Dechloromonas sp.]
MRISATGPCKRHSGFTLIEILVTLAIIAIVAGGIALTLPEPHEAERRSLLQAWQMQAATAARRARAEARPWAWEISKDGARLLIGDDERWQAVRGDAGRVLPLPPDLRVDRVDIEGQIQDGVRRIVFAAIPPLFVVELAGAGQRWQIAGRANGGIVLERLL